MEGCIAFCSLALGLKVLQLQGTYAGSSQHKVRSMIFGSKMRSWQRNLMTNSSQARKEEAIEAHSRGRAALTALTSRTSYVSFVIGLLFALCTLFYYFGELVDFAWLGRPAAGFLLRCARRTPYPFLHSNNLRWLCLQGQGSIDRYGCGLSGLLASRS